jgi:hypothetical protein
MTTPNERSDTAPNPLALLLDFRFTRFITVRIIQVLYLVGIVIIALYTLAGVIGVFQAGAVKGILALILSPLVFLISVLILRVYLELIAVIFRIAENTSRLVGAAEKPHTH